MDFNSMGQIDGISSGWEAIVEYGRLGNNWAAFFKKERYNKQNTSQLATSGWPYKH